MNIRQSWKDDSAGQISNTNYAKAARNCYGGNWHSVYGAEQSTQGIEVGYNNLIARTKSDREMRGVTGDVT